MSSENIQTDADQINSSYPIHRKLVKSLFLATAALSIVTTLDLLLSKNSAILLTVASAGALGAFVSALRRLFAYEQLSPGLASAASAEADSFYIAAFGSIPPLVGAIFAVVAYLVFSSGVIKSAMFPIFSCATNQSCDSFENFLEWWGPAGPLEYSKVLVWGFVAGFSERFVPDILEKLVNMSKYNK